MSLSLASPIFLHTWTLHHKYLCLANVYNLILEIWKVRFWKFTNFNKLVFYMGIVLGQHLNRRLFAPQRLNILLQNLKKVFSSILQNRNSKLPITRIGSKDTRLGGYWKYIWLSWLTSLTHSTFILSLSFSSSNEWSISLLIIIIKKNTEHQYIIDAQA